MSATAPVASCALMDAENKVCALKLDLTSTRHILDLLYEAVIEFPPDEEQHGERALSIVKALLPFVDQQIRDAEALEAALVAARPRAKTTTP